LVAANTASGVGSRVLRRAGGNKFALGRRLWRSRVLVRHGEADHHCGFHRDWRHLPAGRPCGPAIHRSRRLLPQRYLGPGRGHVLCPVYLRRGGNGGGVLGRIAFRWRHAPRCADHLRDSDLRLPRRHCHPGRGHAVEWRRGDGKPVRHRVPYCRPSRCLQHHEFCGADRRPLWCQCQPVRGFTHALFPGSWRLRARTLWPLDPCRRATARTARLLFRHHSCSDFRALGAAIGVCFPARGRPFRCHAGVAGHAFRPHWFPAQAFAGTTLRPFYAAARPGMAFRGRDCDRAGLPGRNLVLLPSDRRQRHHLRGGAHPLLLGHEEILGGHYNVEAMSDDLLRYRPEFPILERTTYLISNSLGAMPRGVYDALHSYADTWASRGVRAWEERWWMLAAQVGDQIGALMNAPRGSVATFQNVTTCQAVVASCFDFSGKRNKIVYSDLNFPSVMYFWEAQRSRGARVHMVKTDDGIHVPTERLLEAIDE